MTKYKTSVTINALVIKDTGLNNSVASTHRDFQLRNRPENYRLLLTQFNKNNMILFLPAGSLQRPAP